jgi:Skp family chaperone for outer membrane proteins
MDISGASKKLDQLLDHFQKHMRNLQEDVLPKIKEFERQESLIKEINKTLTNEQKNSLKKDGYIQMNSQQLQMVYNEKGEKLELIVCYNIVF